MELETVVNVFDSISSGCCGFGFGGLKKFLTELRAYLIDIPGLQAGSLTHYANLTVKTSGEHYTFLRIARLPKTSEQRHRDSV